MTALSTYQIISLIISSLIISTILWAISVAQKAYEKLSLTASKSQGEKKRGGHINAIRSCAGNRL